MKRFAYLLAAALVVLPSLGMSPGGLPGGTGSAQLWTIDDPKDHHISGAIPIWEAGSNHPCLGLAPAPNLQWKVELESASNNQSVGDQGHSTSTSDWGTTLLVPGTPPPPVGSQITPYTLKLRGRDAPGQPLNFQA
ncbi:MAG: hypothetical protein NXI04_28785 [Planctomycetaceae bacterium]|nr:hypothetical protein [Planctomycetaceae bacterium]